MKRERKSRGAIYGSILRHFLLVTTVLIIAASAALYTSYEGIALRQAYENDRDDLEKSRNQILSMRSLARTLASQIYYDVNVAYLLYGGDFNAYQLRAAIAQLDNYRLTIPFVESVYVYNGAEGSLSVSSGGFGGFGIPVGDGAAFWFDPGIPSIIARLGEIDPLTPLTRRVAAAASQGSRARNYCSFVFKEGLRPGGPASAVIVNFSDKWLYRSIDGGPASSRAVITDLAGSVVSNSPEYAMGRDLATEGFFAEVAASLDSSGHLIASVGGVKSLVTYLSPDSIGWRYLKITPYSAVTGGIRKIRLLTLAFDLVFILVGVAASFAASRQLYKPIGKVEENLEALEKENQGIRGLREEQRLRELLTSKGAGVPRGDGQGAPESMRLVLVRIDESTRLEKELGPEERSALRRAALGLAAARFPRAWTVRTADMGESGNLALVVAEDDGSSRVTDDAFLASMAEDAKASILAELGYSVSFVIGGSCGGVGELNALYERASEALRHRIFAGQGAVLFASAIAEKNARFYSYPARKEEALIDAVMEGRAGKASDLVRELLLDACGYSFAVFNGCVSRLVITIGNIANSVRRNNLVHIPDEILARIAAPVNPYLAESLGEIETFLFDLVEEVVACVSEKRGARHDELIARVDALIESRYPDQGICLESLADEVEMSAAYLGRIYKRHTLKGVAERITEIRVREAKRLLLEDRRLSVAEVAARVGFAGGSYFAKLFRKETSLTPNEFRRDTRSQ